MHHLELVFTCFFYYSEINTEIANLFLNCQVVEIPRGCKVKYELDKGTGLIKVRPYMMLE
jgi:inorganic pyrophosphatase